MKLHCQHPGDAGRTLPMCGRELEPETNGPDFTNWRCPEHGWIVMWSSDAMDDWWTQVGVSS
jgi:hypothetical protein